VPKTTFNNLPKEKQQKIFDAAVEEFSTKTFSNASINQIIKNAEIPRGSFYQYFNDKEDIYLYMISEIGKEKLVIAKDVDKTNPNADFFESYYNMFKIILDWAKDKPKYMKIGLLMNIDDSSFIEKFRQVSRAGFQLQKEMLSRDKERGLIKSDVDVDLVVDMLYTLNMSIQAKYFKDGDYNKMLEKLTEIIKIIKGGIANV